MDSLDKILMYLNYMKLNFNHGESKKTLIYLAMIEVSRSVKYFAPAFKFVWFPLAFIESLTRYVHFSNSVFLILL